MTGWPAGGQIAAKPRSGGGFDVDGVAEGFELSHQSAGAVFGVVAGGDPVGAKVVVVDLVLDDVPVGDDQVVADRAGGLGTTPAMRSSARRHWYTA